MYECMDFEMTRQRPTKIRIDSIEFDFETVFFHHYRLVFVELLFVFTLKADI